MFLGDLQSAALNDSECVCITQDLEAGIQLDRRRMSLKWLLYIFVNIVEIVLPNSVNWKWKEWSTCSDVFSGVMMCMVSVFSVCGYYPDTCSSLCMGFDNSCI